MADMITNFFEFLMNGKTAGIPNMAILIAIAAILVIFYLLLTRKPRLKEFKPLDMKKETKRRFKREYKYFGVSLNQNIYPRPKDEYDKPKPAAYAIGYMKVVEMLEKKRLEPIWTNFPKEKVVEKHELLARDIYNKDYANLNEVEKKNIDDVTKEELRYEKVDEISANERIKIVRGKREVPYSVPIPMFLFKICSPSFFSKLLARFIGYGVDWALLNKDQVIFESTRITLTADFQRRTPNDIFVFSHAGTNLIEDIAFGVERENIWQETANQIPRAVHFDTEASKSLLYRREDAKIDKEKHKAQTESHEL